MQVEEPFDVLPLFQYCQGIAATCDGMVKGAHASCAACRLSQRLRARTAPFALADAHNDHITLSKDLEVERTGPQILVEDMGALEASFNMRNAAQQL